MNLPGCRIIDLDFFVRGQVRGMKWIKDSKNRKYILVGINDDEPKLFELNE